MYRIANENQHRKKLTKVDDLYQACAGIVGVSGGIVLDYYSQLIAFYCDHDKKVKAGYGAERWEIDRIRNYNFYA